MPIVVSCAACQGTIRVPDTAIGRMVKCPKCAQGFRVRDPHGAPGSTTNQVPTPVTNSLPKPATPAASGKISVSCPTCKKKMQAPSKLAGKAVKCLACGKLMRIPSATATVPAQVPVPVPVPVSVPVPVQAPSFPDEEEWGEDWIEVNVACPPPRTEPSSSKATAPSGDWGQALLEEQELPEKMQEEIRAELSGNEQVTWAARPNVEILLDDARRYRMIGVPVGGIIGLTGLILTVYFIIEGITPGIIIAPIFGLAFSAIAVYAYRMPGIVERNAPNRACFVMTNRRVLVHPGSGSQVFIQGGQADGVQSMEGMFGVSAWTALEMMLLARVDHKRFEGAGDISFGRTLDEKVGSKSFWALDNVRDVEKRLREKLIHPLVEKLLLGELVLKDSESKDRDKKSKDDEVVAPEGGFLKDIAAKLQSQGPLTYDPRKIPTELREQVDDELTKGEAVLWIGEPEAKAKGRGLVGALTRADHHVEPKYELYAITNLRAILWVEKVGPLSYYPPELMRTGFEKDKRIEEGGSIIFRKIRKIIRTKDKDGKISERKEMHYFGLLRIANAEAVADLLRRTLINPVRVEK